MRLVVIRQQTAGGTVARPSLLQYALTTSPLASVVLNGSSCLWGCGENDSGLARLVGRAKPDNISWVVPGEWQRALPARIGATVSCAHGATICTEPPREACKHQWLAVSNGRFATHINGHLLVQLLTRVSADAVVVTAAPDLQACRERVRLTREGNLVGYRRLYCDSMEPTPMPEDWPHHLLIRRQAVERVFANGLPPGFDRLVEGCRTRGLRLRAVAVAGSVMDLDSADGLLRLCRAVFAHLPQSEAKLSLVSGRPASAGEGHGGVSAQPHIVGSVLIGENVLAEPDAVIIGPSILCDNSIVHSAAVVDGSIVGAGMTIESGRVVRDSIVASPACRSAEDRLATVRGTRRRWESPCPRQSGAFRKWPRLSYAGCFKRLVDVVAAVLVLILFAPVIPFIALAVKISSSGPVFFRDRRQGLHGKAFNCIKFRTMRVGAEDIQDTLRFVSEVDGPQFKMADDPRISTVGRFLRETYLDEIPQFFNVLCGQMSVVGPRPSPESENTLCPSWRDARLSVRPGITGLWQVCRTREPLRDFQEWIHYDTRYVRELSWRRDLWICWRTFVRMLRNFAHQFGT